MAGISALRSPSFINKAIENALADTTEKETSIREE
jgi:hypothetical protein